MGETRPAQEWAGQRLREIQERGVGPVLAAIVRWPSRRGPRPNVTVFRGRGLRQYLVRCQGLEMLNYPAALAAGWDIGSDPTEAMCKTLTLRLKRPGMKWDADHAAPLMNLIALYESGQADAYWKSRRAA